MDNRGDIEKMSQAKDKVSTKFKKCCNEMDKVDFIGKMLLKYRHPKINELMHPSIYGFDKF